MPIGDAFSTLQNFSMMPGRRREGPPRPMAPGAGLTEGRPQLELPAPVPPGIPTPPVRPARVAAPAERQFGPGVGGPMGMGIGTGGGMAGLMQMLQGNPQISQWLQTNPQVMQILNSFMQLFSGMGARGPGRGLVNPAEGGGVANMNPYDALAAPLDVPNYARGVRGALPNGMETLTIS